MRRYRTQTRKVVSSRLNAVFLRGAYFLSPLLFICFLNDILCDFDYFPMGAFDWSDYLIADLGAFAVDLAIFVTGGDFCLLRARRSGVSISFVTR